MTSTRPKQMEAYRYTGAEPVTVFHRTIYPGEVVDLWPGQAAQYPDLFVPAGQSVQVEAKVEANVEPKEETRPAEEMKAKAESKPASTRRTSRRKSTRSKQADGAEPETKGPEDDA